MAKTRRRRIWISMGAVIVLGLLAVILLPFWFPWLLGPLGGRFGLHYDDYERVGFGRFALEEVSFTNANVRFQAERVEAPAPTSLLWGRATDGAGDVSVRDWRLDIAEKSRAPAAPRTNTPADTLERIESTFEQMNPWIGRATLTNGTIQLPGQTASVPWMVWNDDVLRGSVEMDVPGLGRTPLEVTAEFSAPGAANARIAAPKLDLVSTVAVERSNGSLVVETTNRWGTNVIHAAAGFGESAMPDWARVSAQDLFIPATKIPARGYSAEIKTLQGAWTTGQYNVEISFRGVPTETNLPPLTGEVVARGDTNAATIEELHVESPALSADLSNPVRFSYSGKLLSGPARLAVTGDLARLPLADLQGRFAGAVAIERTVEGNAQVGLDLRITNAVAREIEVKSASLEGRLNWPVLRVQELQAQLESGAGIEAQGTVNLAARVVSNAMVRWDGPVPTNLAPAALNYSNLLATAEVSGPFTNLTHRAAGTLTGVDVAGLLPLVMQFREQGEQFDIESFQLAATGHGARLELAGAATWRGTNATVQLNALQYFTDWPPDGTDDDARALVRATGEEEALYSLEKPITAELSLATNEPPRIVMTPLHWRGEGRCISLGGGVTWPSHGDASIAMTNLRLAQFTNWLETPPPFTGTIERLDASARWTNGPVFFALNTEVSADLTNTPPLRVALTATNDATTIHLPQFTVATALNPAAERAKMVVTGSAVLPVTVTGTTKGFGFQAHEEAPLRAEVRAVEAGTLSTLIEEFTKVAVQDPSLELTLRGTVGALTASAESITPLTLTCTGGTTTRRGRCT